MATGKHLFFRRGHFLSVDNNTRTEGECDVRFNKVIWHLLQVGILDQWFRDIKKYTTFLSSAAQTGLPTGEFVKLNLLHMQSAVYILLLGLIPSFIAFHSEILFCRNALSLQLWTHRNKDSSCPEHDTTVTHEVTDILEELAASIFRVLLTPWRWRQHSLPRSQLLLRGDKASHPSNFSHRHCYQKLKPRKCRNARHQRHTMLNPLD